MDALTVLRSIQSGVAESLLHDLYTALKGNALFVYLAADSMRYQSVVDAASLIRQIEQNPNDIFSIKLERIKNRSELRWPTIWKPMLALLLVTQEPLRLDVLGDLLGHDYDAIQDAVWVFGGLVSHGINQLVALHHLMFRDYLATSMFTAREVKRWHQQLAHWCAVDLDVIWSDDRDPIEQSRRVYARHHYITHLFFAENWPMLWQILDAGDYGEHKTRFDPSTRLYALDLDRGRESTIQAGQSTEEHIQHLPRLWKYCLLRISLTSRVDRWPDEAFEVLAMLGSVQEALERIDLLSHTYRQIQCWDRIIPWCNNQQRRTIILRLHQVASYTSGIVQFHALDILVKISAITSNSQQAIGILETVLAITQSIEEPWQHVDLLRAIAQAAAIHGYAEYAITILDTAITIIRSIDYPEDQADLFRAIAGTAACLGNIDRALVIAQAIDNPEYYIYTIRTIAEAAVTHGHDEHAKTILDTALDIAQSIDNPWRRADILRVIAETTATHGQDEYAKTILDTALAIAQSLDNQEQRDNTLASIAITAATIGNINLTLVITQSIDNPWRRADIFRVIAEATATHGHVEHAMTILNAAITIAESLNYQEQFADILASIAKAAATLGDIDRALTITQSMIDEPWQRANILASIAKISAIHGHTDYAKTILDTVIAITQSIDHPQQRTHTIKSTAEATADLSDITGALTIAQSLDEPWHHADTLASIAIKAATMGNIDRALVITQSIDEPWRRADILRDVAEATATHGHAEHAMIILNTTITIAQCIDEPWQRANTIASIAKAAATLGDINRALAIVQFLDNQEHRANTIASIAKAAATLGDIDRALAIVQSIDEPWQRVVPLSDIAKAAATFGDIDRALAIVQSIDEPWRRIFPLISIAEASKTHRNPEYTMTILDTMLNIAQSIVHTAQRVDILKIIAQIDQSLTRILVIMQKEWVRSTISKDLWTITAIVLPLLKKYPWLGVSILEEEAWVNEHLKKLG
ncbi:hypothetical protein [Herpetosiphon llansteffanensis]|uniref:hypothetical protein n=1 Tax=Herpetosiphon llansteffanensis TaxID=2094568 RepID=UPI00196B33F2|nr:hypothetical protein [Herpetosiphon llansteffanensis]